MTAVEEEQGTRRYAPTIVTRYVGGGRGGRQEALAVYADATVRDNGEDYSVGLGVPAVMLRAYSNDPEVWGAWDKHDEWFVCDKKHAKHYGDSLRGYVLDCDGDIALERVYAIKLGHHSWGHAAEQFTVLVSQNENGEWDGFGFGDERGWRIERWEVTLADDEAVAASRGAGL